MCCTNWSSEVNLDLFWKQVFSYTKVVLYVYDKSNILPRIFQKDHDLLTDMRISIMLRIQNCPNDDFPSILFRSHDLQKAVKVTVLLIAP
jgi:hypothetical protein